MTIVERPKVIYNEKTSQYVMFLHVDDEPIRWSQVAILKAPAVTGPYKFVRHIWPAGLESRDIGIFTDFDGVSYLMTATGHVNTDLSIF
jgi:hypothetical protein